MTIREKLGDKFYDEVTTQSVIGNAASGLSGKNTLRAAFIGGSVTFGYCPGSEGSTAAFPEFVGGYLSEKYNSSEILNLGISGTTSLMGLVTTELRVREFAPDIVFVEYAINDEMSRQGAECFESLVRKLLTLESRPVVVPVCVCTDKGHSCVPMIREICSHYGLLCVDIKESVYPLFSKELEWSDYSVDEGHPHSEGSRLIADCVIKAIEKLSLLPHSNITLPLPKFSARLEGLLICNEYKTDFERRQEPLFCFDNCLEASGRCSLTAELECSYAVAVYISSNDKGYGSLEAYEGTEKLCELSGYSLFGWYNPVIQHIINDKEKTRHSVTMKLSDSDRGKKFRLICIAYC
ncbi:MAG: SGNH/GDSL hydrolase family protein [Oscillospiraceae bacterium]|nr:SGNH/GDSL hydrolase family protein [Oscillospiraceae bacterium]